jgi:oligopeptide/dipeptide ABC transporter ATP-binding protein
LSYLFISHDLSVMRYICDRIAVMYLGEIVEMGDRDEIFERPSRPYTQALLSAAPLLRPWLVSDRRPVELTGEIPSPTNPPSGCRFRTRCWKAVDVCASDKPALERHDVNGISSRSGNQAACHFAEPREIPDSGGATTW